MRTAVVVIVLLVLAGCAGTTGERAAAPEPSVGAEVHEAWSSCASSFPSGAPTAERTS